MTAQLAHEHDHAPEQHAYHLPYHWCMSFFQKYVVQQAVSRVASLVRDKNVLEMGCGDGFATSLLAKHARRIHAFDINERAIGFAKMIVEEPNVSFEVGTAADLAEMAKGLEATADVVVSFEVIEHLGEEEREAFLRESFELLAPVGGSLVLSTPNGTRSRANPNPHHAREFRPDELAGVLVDARFHVMELSGLYLQPPWIRLEHFADTVPFRAIFRRLARAGREKPSQCRTLICVAAAS